MAIDYVCAMWFWEHVEMFVIVSGAAIWVYATNYLTERVSDRWYKRPAKQDFEGAFEGWAFYNAVAYWLQTEQTNKSKKAPAHW